MNRRMSIMLICLAILFGCIIAYKVFAAIMIKRFLSSNQSPIVTVSTMKVGYTNWQTLLKATGTIRSVQGVNVTTELAGMVKSINFEPGAIVKQGDLLVELNIAADVAQLQSIQANADLAQITYNRDKLQYAAQGISKQVLDTDAANLKSLQAQVTQQIATIAKKTIHAPFSGRTGIIAIDIGQYLNPGDKIVALQQLDPIYVDFYVPQQEIPRLQIGQEVKMNLDAFPKTDFTGKITTIDPVVDENTRNVEVEATIPNSDLKLLPGMFSTVYVTIGAPQPFLTLPQTAITFNPYGNIIYIVGNDGNDKSGKPILTVKQNFVTTGNMRGDQITVLKGLKAGDEIVTSGQLKLKNGTQIAVNNTVMPSNNPSPDAPNEY